MNKPQKRDKKAMNEVEFEGFDPVMNQRHFFTYPIILASYWHELSGSEQKCLDFILRQTMGWQKDFDYLALSQFCTGIRGSANKGTGLSKSQVRRAIDGLEAKKFIYVDRHQNRPSKFTLNIASVQRDAPRKGASQFILKSDVTVINENEPMRVRIEDL